MKHLLIAFVAVALVSGLGFAGGYLETDNISQPVQGFAPNGRKAQALTVVKTTVDMRGDVAWMHYGTTACSFRAMTSATVVGQKLTLPASTPNLRYVNSRSPFLNFTGCTAGELVRQ